MEFENRHRPRWYQIFALLIFASGVIYSVLVSNPYLYSGKKFSEALAGKKNDQYTPLSFQESPLSEKDKLGTEPLRGGWQRRASENSGETRDRRYVETKVTPLLFPENFGTPSYKLTSQELIAFFDNGEVHSYDLDGEFKWSFQSQFGQGPYYIDPIVTKETITFAKESGRIFQINRETGKLIWVHQLKGKILSDIFLWSQKFYFVRTFQFENEDEKVSKKTAIQEMDPKTGGLTKPPEIVNLAQKTVFSFSERNQILYLSSGERLMALQIPSLNTIWQKNLSSEVVGPVTLVNKVVVTPLKEGKVKFFKQSNGTDIGEVDLGHPVSSPMGHIPIYNRASVVTDNGYLHVIDIDGFDRMWRFDLNNENKTSLTWSARLSGNFIEELSMKWRYKGWTVWSPCVKNRICIYNPEKGQIIGRVMLSGALASEPRFSKHGFQALLKKSDQFFIGNYTEKPYFKKNPDLFKDKAPIPPAEKTLPPSEQPSAVETKDSDKSSDAG